ncbi:hypothetical protein APASM_5676 [Actinosynnema pretiosum subsp. pretiosum]|nr:hypothetical protein APASM_5676 [Actinosynnema pretiosum subsp. pretiosum]
MQGHQDQAGSERHGRETASLEGHLLPPSSGRVVRRSAATSLSRTTQRGAPVTLRKGPLDGFTAWCES